METIISILFLGVLHFWGIAVCYVMIREYILNKKNPIKNKHCFIGHSSSYLKCTKCGVIVDYLNPNHRFIYSNKECLENQ